MMTLCAFITGVSELLVAGVLDHVARDVGVSLGTAGTLIFWHAAAYAVAPPLLLLLARTDDQRLVLVAALTAFAAASFAAADAPTFVWLAGARIAQGAAGGVVLAVAITVATSVASPQNRGKALSSVLMGLSLALVVGVPLGIQVTELLNWRLAFAGVGAAALAAAFAVGARGRFVASATTQTGGAPARNDASSNVRTIAFIASLSWMSGYASVFSYVAPLLKLEFGLTGGSLSAGILAFGVACMMGAWLGGALTDHASNAIAALVGASFNLVVYALFYVLPRSPSGAMAFLALWGMASWIIVPAIQSILTWGASERRASIVLSINNSLIQIGICVGSIAGSLVVGFDPTLVVPIGSAFLAITFLCAAMIAQKRRRRSQAA